MKTKEEILAGMREVDPDDSIAAIECMEVTGHCTCISETHPIYIYLESEGITRFGSKFYLNKE